MNLIFAKEIKRNEIKWIKVSSVINRKKTNVIIPQKGKLFRISKLIYLLVIYIIHLLILFSEIKRSQFIFLYSLFQFSGEWE